VLVPLGQGCKGADIGSVCVEGDQVLSHSKVSVYLEHDIL